MGALNVSQLNLTATGGRARSFKGGPVTITAFN